MKEYIIPSIKISDINMEKCYFNPGCALSVYKPASEHKLLELLNRYFGPVKMHNICCHHDPGLPQGSTIINNCAGCDRRFRSLYEGIQTISLWEALDSIEDLPLPDYSGLTLSVHDSCSYRPKPQVHAAVRSLLGKMNIKVIDSEFSGTKSICCGDNFYPRLSIEKVTELQKKRAAQMPCQDVAVYCVSCIKSMAIGGKTPHHMTDLVLGEETELQEMRIDVYHDTLEAYIACH
ncbi:(Fe-S)-binding protein [uncultured Clostridium sp.]|uniref:(Fe-S)-binding protein n=1 Tax=uncultured Clostridium sp. TaxID=59620 RepID=UPI0025F78D8C|nr:(Fe-S)-binding protein [uncultured Clostridium sp.]